MGLKDLYGVFSRFFVSGFFLPAFFTLFALSLTASARFRPAEFDAAKRTDQVLVLGGLALLLGLVLLGLRYRVTRIFEGYDFYLLPLWLFLVWAQRKARARLAKKGPSVVRLLDRRFPDEDDRLLPTRFGNAMRAAEDHAYKRWRLDHVLVWPRLDALMPESERELHANARSDLYFFMNLTIGALVVGVLLAVDEFLSRRLHGLTTLLYLVPFGVAYVLYRFSVGAAERWGTEMRATVDLHRLELYDRLGIKRPVSFSDERDRVAPALNAFLLESKPLPDDLFGIPEGGLEKNE